MLHTAILSVQDREWMQRYSVSVLSLQIMILVNLAYAISLSFLMIMSSANVTLLDVGSSLCELLEFALCGDDYYNVGDIVDRYFKQAFCKVSIHRACTEDRCSYVMYNI